MHGLVLYSERAGILRPAVLWLDRRADAEAAEYQRLPDDLRAPLGNDPSLRSDQVPAPVEPRASALAERAYREFRSVRA
jgi:hypothetical protein